MDLIRGRGVEEALSILHFTPKHAAKVAEKALRSAISNFQNKEEAGRVDLSEIYVKEAYVDGGPVLKRILPAPMGRAYVIRKRSNHITIVVARREKLIQTEQETTVMQKKKEAKIDKEKESKVTTET